MTAGFSIMLVLLLASYGVFTSSLLLRLPFAFLFAFLCAGAGKAAGIYLARRRLRLELDQIRPSAHPLPKEIQDARYLDTIDIHLRFASNDRV